MFDLETRLLFHLHGDERVPMRRHPDPTSGDIDRALARGETVYRCGRCAEEVVITHDAERSQRDPHIDR